jgi:hypothetical protein
MVCFICRATLQNGFADVTEAIDLYYESMHTRCCSTLVLFCFSLGGAAYLKTHRCVLDAVRALWCYSAAGRVLLIELHLHLRGYM